MKNYLSAALLLSTFVGLAAQAELQGVAVSCQARDLLNPSVSSQIAITFDNNGQMTVAAADGSVLVDASRICGVTLTDKCQGEATHIFGALTGLRKSCGLSSIWNGKGEYYPSQEASVILDAKLDHGFVRCDVIESGQHRDFELSSCQSNTK